MVISRNITDRRLVELQEMSSCAVARTLTYLRQSSRPVLEQSRTDRRPVQLQSKAHFVEKLS